MDSHILWSVDLFYGWDRQGRLFTKKETTFAHNLVRPAQAHMHFSNSKFGIRNSEGLKTKSGSQKVQESKSRNKLSRKPETKKTRKSMLLKSQMTKLPPSSARKSAVQLPPKPARQRWAGFGETRWRDKQDKKGEVKKDLGRRAYTLEF